jgi:hypothetical protein
MVDPGNKSAIAALVQMLQSNIKDYITFMLVASSLIDILNNNQNSFAVVKALSGYWRFDSHCYNVIWNCAQNMPYPDFYQAWHQHNITTRAMRSLARIFRMF